VWTNTYLGETWEDAGEQIDDYDLAERREVIEHIPDDVMFLTCGDVYRIIDAEALIGWGRDDESWVIEHVTFWGDPSAPHLWTNLDSVLFKTI
jgi:phage terminase large subunit GpA-like protein